MSIFTDAALKSLHAGREASRSTFHFQAVLVTVGCRHCSFPSALGRGSRAAAVLQGLVLLACSVASCLAGEW